MYGFPATYQPMQNMQYNQPYQQYQTTNQIQQPTQQQQQTFQFGGLFRVQSLDDVHRGEIRPGELQIFITMDGSFLFTKELGFSPMDRPVIRKFKAFDDSEYTNQSPAVQQNDLSMFAHKSEIDDLKLEIDVLKEQIENMKGKRE